MEIKMKESERKILEKFKSLLEKKLSVHKIVLFGSRARGEASETSDMDVLVILEEINSETDLDYVSECGWESGFEQGIVLVPIVYSRHSWENSPERSSLLALAVEREGMPV
jgi:uncharacterized protein